MFVAGLNFSSEKNVVSTSGIKKEFQISTHKHTHTHTHTNTHKTLTRIHKQTHTHTNIVEPIQTNIQTELGTSRQTKIIKMWHS